MENNKLDLKKINEPEWLNFNADNFAQLQLNLEELNTPKSTDPIISYNRTINYYKSHKQSYIDNICNLLKKDINILEEGQYQLELKITLIEKFNEPNK